MSNNITYKINLNNVETQYFIDTYGKIHKYKGDLSDIITSMHFEIAEDLYPNHNKPKDVLNKLGWVTIGSVVYQKPIIYKKPTQAQINKLDQLGLLDHLLILNDGYFISYLKEYL